MKITVNGAFQLADEFKSFNRDYYSLEGYSTLLDYYNSIDDDMELDVIAICGEWNEYGEDCALSFECMLFDYGYLLDDIDDIDELDVDDKITLLADKLEYRTTVIELNNGNYLIGCF